MIKRRKFQLGTRIKPNTTPTTLEGEQTVNSSDYTFRVYLDGSERTVVTEDQTQTLENKTHTDPVLNGDVSGTAIDTDDSLAADSDTKIPSQKAVKAYVDDAVANADDASEISYDNTSSGLTADNVQDAIDEVEDRVDTVEVDVVTAQSTADDHIADSADAHTASAITNVASGNLAADNVQDALDELQTDVDTRALDSALTAHISDSDDAHDASAISYDNATSSLTATDTQAAIDEVEGRLDTAETSISTNASDLTDHIAESSTHGVSGDIVGTTDAQVITNKDIDGGTASNTNRITLPKNTKTNLDGLTRKEGTVVYASDEEKAYIDNGTDLIPVGSGSGGTLDVFYSETFETTGAADFAKGNDADFNGGGSLDGTLSNETSSPISGESSLKYTMGSSSTDDYIKSPNIALDRKQQGQTVGMEFYYSYDGDDNDIAIVAYDDTNSEVLTSTVDFLKAAGSPQRFSVQFPTNTDTANLNWGIKVVTGNSGAVLVIDDVQITTNPYVSKDLLNITTVNGSGNAGTSITASTVDIDFIVVKDDNNVWSGTSYSVQDSNSIVSMKGGVYFDAPAVRRVSLFLNGSFYQILDSGTSAIDYHDFVFESHKGEFGVNDLLTIRVDTNGGTLLNSSIHYININETSTTDQVIAYNSRNAENSMVRLHTGNGHGSTNTKIRRFSTLAEPIKGNAITYTDSATDGASFMINEDGVYMVSYTDSSPTANSYWGLSLNSTQLTTNMAAITSTDRLTLLRQQNSTTPQHLEASFAGFLRKGDVVRAHTNGLHIETSGAYFTISKIGVGDLLGVPVPRTCYIKDVKPSGTDGGTFTSGAWQTRDLNTLEGDTEFVSLDSNQFVLEVGKYEIEAEANANEVDGHKIKLRDVDNSIDIIIGVNNEARLSGNAATVSSLKGVLEITTSTVFEIQHRCDTTKTTNGFGKSVSFGVDEIYTQVKITKVS